MPVGIAPSRMDQHFTVAIRRPMGVFVTLITFNSFPNQCRSLCFTLVLYFRTSHLTHRMRLTYCRSQHAVCRNPPSKILGDKVAQNFVVLSSSKLLIIIHHGIFVERPIG
jgi:hypothetical protein